MYSKLKFKPLLSFALVLMMVISLFSINIISANAQENIGGAGMGIIVAEGKCGFAGTDKAYWILDTTGKLTILGVGDIEKGWSGYESQIKSVVFEGKFTIIGPRTFEYCTALESITIPEGVTDIQHRAFGDCTNLTSVTIPRGVSTITQELFENCTSLTTVNMPDSMRTIGPYAFKNCTALKNPNLPEYVTTISYNAFEGCTGLTSFTVPPNIQNIDERVFLNCTNLKSITFHDSFTTIGENAFENCTSLTDITLPDSFRTIQDCAFKGCTGLKSIDIPSSTLFILNLAFEDCTSLDSIYIYSPKCYIDTHLSIPEHTTIYGYTGSTAELFAKDNNRKFVTLDLVGSGKPETNDKTESDTTVDSKPQPTPDQIIAGSNTSTTSPQTGDASVIYLCIMMALISACVAALTFKLKATKE